ncbi:MAG TPA: nitrile hydratase subunit beta [Acidimicrobiales bacterium]|nr:nitrile hydratase subunit beta [Acidimicrobiales bacterium]
MDGIHDLGGVQGFGAVDHSPSEPVFAEEWERRAVRVMLAANIGLRTSGPAFRHSIERMDPTHYLASSYYEHWLTGVSTLAVEGGLTSAADLSARAGGVFPLSAPNRGTASPGPHEDRSDPSFSIGDRVRVRSLHPLGHTRAPRYVQGKRGVVTRIDGAFNFPDLEAHGERVLDPEYSVAFTARELWGDGATDDSVVHVDLCERYLEADT